MHSPVGSGNSGQPGSEAVEAEQAASSGKGQEAGVALLLDKGKSASSGKAAIPAKPKMEERAVVLAGGAEGKPKPKIYRSPDEILGLATVLHHWPGLQYSQVYKQLEDGGRTLANLRWPPLLAPQLG